MNYYGVDAIFTNSGDYLVDNRGDLQDTAKLPCQCLLQSIRTTFKSASDDWGMFNGMIVANWKRYLGDLVNQKLIDNLKAGAVRSLITSNTLIRGTFSLSLAPVGSAVVSRLSVDVSGTPQANDFTLGFVMDSHGDFYLSGTDIKD